MEPKKYGLAVLRKILGGDVEKEMPQFVLKDDGLHLDLDAKSYSGAAEWSVLRWHMREDDELPALPLPFSAHELAAFSLAGCGTFLWDRYDEGEDGSLDASTKEQLGPNSGGAWEVLQEAHRLRGNALRKFGHDDEGVRRAAAWLLNDGRLEDTAGADVAGSPIAATAAMDAAKGKKQNWFEVAIPYIADRLRAGRFATAKELFNALEAEVDTAGSPFDRGTDRHRGSLYLRSIGKPVAMKTFQNRWREMREAADQR